MTRLPEHRESPSPRSGPAKDDRSPPAGGGAFSPGAFAGLGIQFVLAILLFLFVGKWLDQKLGTSPWLLIVGTFLGASAGFYSMYRRLMSQPPSGPTKGV